VLRWVGWGIAAGFRARASLVAENICLRQQLLVLRRRRPRPRLRDVDRRFWVLACRWFAGWRRSLLIVEPVTVLRWHRRGWRAYWRWRSRRRSKAGRPPIPPELRDLIRRMASENHLWGQRRIQAELARLGFQVSARSIAKYRRRPWDGEPSPSWPAFLKRHASAIWACDFLCVQTILFRTLCSSWSITPAGQSSASRRRGIRRRSGRADRSSNAAAGIGSHHAFSSTIVTRAMVRSLTSG
jgi:putative transposase